MSLSTLELLLVGHKYFLSSSEISQADDTANSSINWYNLEVVWISQSGCLVCSTLSA